MRRYGLTSAVMCEKLQCLYWKFTQTTSNELTVYIPHQTFLLQPNVDLSLIM